MRRHVRNALAKLFGPPKDAAWQWLPIDLLCSAAWRSRSINCVRFIEFLVVEHRNHGGRENGKLAAPYDQLVAFGLTRSRIEAAISEAESLGLIRAARGGRWAGTNTPSRYRLTFFANHDAAPATNDWKTVSKRQARDFRRDQSAGRTARATWRRNLKNQAVGSTSETTVVRKVTLPSGADNDATGEMHGPA
ncbi:MAG: hypothetical protein KBA31_00805 [Alphaproteobacteria bacterium]|nr:hypothetical protein [Alphaproteobacteria bacterium]